MRNTHLEFLRFPRHSSVSRASMDFGALLRANKKGNGKPVTCVNKTIFLRWHYPNQVTGHGIHPTLSLLMQAPLFYFALFYCE